MGVGYAWSNRQSTYLGYAEAARVTAGLVEGARALGRSGVTLKDTSRALDAGTRSALD